MVATLIRTETQFADFDRDGFVLVESAFSPTGMSIIEK